MRSRLYIVYCKHILLGTLLLVASAMYAQVDTAELAPVVFERDFLPNLETHVDSVTKLSMLGHSLDQHLAQLGGFYIKNYGLGNISTVSYRGGNASQIGLQWNGIPLQNIALGSIDFSLIPAGTSDELSFSTANTQSNFGLIKFDNSPVFDGKPRLQSAHHYALHDLLSNHMTLRLSAPKHSLRISGIHRKGTNSYPIWDGMGPSRQTHASINQKNLTIDYTFKLRASTTLQLAYWGQRYGREIPPVLNASSRATQQDAFDRWLLQLHTTKRKVKISHHHAWLNDALQYTDPEKNLNSETVTHNWLTGFILQTRHRQVSSSTQLQNSYQFSSSVNYRGLIQRNIAFGAQNLNYTSQSQNLHIDIFGKAEWVNAKRNPLQYGLSYTQRIYKGLSGIASAKRYLRNPTFNDLYWQAWGNASLRPEQGFAYDLNLNYQNKARWLQHKTGIALYSKMVKDWLMWLPVNASVWKARNSRKVWARGFEISQHISSKYKHVIVSITGYYTFTKSTYMQSDQTTGDIINKQLIYVPPHQASVSATLDVKAWTLKYTQQYTSWRFTSSDNEEFLDAYTLSSLYIRHSFKVSKKYMVMMDLLIDNVFNKEVQTVANAPMPLRTYKFGIIYQLNP